MKVDRLDCFMQVVKTLNFSKSAEVLHLSQPSISRIITCWNRSWALICLNAIEIRSC